MAKIVKKGIRKFLVGCLVFLTVFVWIYIGQPQIWQNPPFPPEIQKTWAAQSTNSPSTNSGSAWTNPNNAYADNASYANITAGNPSGSNVWGNYGFSLTGSTITQVRVGYDAWSVGVASQSQTMRPTGDDADTATSTVVPSTPTTRWDKVDETSASDADYYQMTTPNNSHTTFTFSAFSVPTNSVITDLTVYYRAGNFAANAANIRASLKINTTYYDTTDAGVDPVDSPNFSTYSKAFTQNPATVAAWTAADINGTGPYSLTAFGTSSSDLNPDVKVSWLYAVVNYTEIDDQIKVDVSWDGGSSWTATQNTTLTSAEATTWYDVTALAGGWTPAKLADGQLQVRALVQSVNSAEVVRLDWLPVEVTYTPPVVVSVIVQDGAVSYGFVALGAAKSTTAGGVNDTQRAGNNGNVTEYFNIMGQNSANWTLVSGTPTGAQYRHRVATDGGTLWTPITTGYQRMASNIAQSTTQDFDLEIMMSNNATTQAQQSVNITIQAVQQ